MRSSEGRGRGRKEQGGEEREEYLGVLHLDINEGNVGTTIYGKKRYALAA